MVNSQIEAYTLKNDHKPDSIDDLIREGYIKEQQKKCKNGQAIAIQNGEARAS